MQKTFDNHRLQVRGLSSLFVIDFRIRWNLGMYGGASHRLKAYLADAGNQVEWELFQEKAMASPCRLLFENC
jgi:hypothetical protein